jgi:tRNA dimethylallyltransferase
VIIPVILGPTCTGKTSLALKIAKEKKANILSIDSRQVFIKLDIGTGKFKEKAEIKKFKGYWEIDGVRIYGYDFLEINEELNVIKFCEFAKKVIEDSIFSNQKLLITCGTGFYLDFLMGNISYNEINPERKTYLNSLNLEKLQKIFFSFENRPAVDEKNKVRLITAILTLENPNSKKHNFKIDNVEFRVFKIEESREVLFKNADAFVESILNGGVVEEYKRLYAEYGMQKPLNGLIYSDIHKFLTGATSDKKTLEERIKFSLHAYIRRQETYFKKINFDTSTKDRNLITEKISNLF